VCAAFDIETAGLAVRARDKLDIFCAAINSSEIRKIAY
jgi:hypothetical protein